MKRYGVNIVVVITINVRKLRHWSRSITSTNNEQKKIDLWMIFCWYALIHVWDKRIVARSGSINISRKINRIIPVINIYNYESYNLQFHVKIVTNLLRWNHLIKYFFKKTRIVGVCHYIKKHTKKELLLMPYNITNKYPINTFVAFLCLKTPSMLWYFRK